MAAQVGIDEAGAKAAMRDSTKTQEVYQTALSWSEKGISGWYKTNVIYTISPYF